MSLKMKYFVLNPKSKCLDDKYALASRVAMRAYAEAIRGTNQKLATQLNTWAREAWLAKMHTFGVSSLLTPKSTSIKKPNPLTAPWPDFLGNPIHEGDKIRRLDGWIGTVFIRKHIMNVSKQWFVNYGDACPSLNLLNEVGDENQAVVIDDCPVKEVAI